MFRTVQVDLCIILSWFRDDIFTGENNIMEISSND